MFTSTHPLNPIVSEVTERVRERSRKERSEYLARMKSETASASTRSRLSCGNLAHGFAAASPTDKVKALGEFKADQIEAVKIGELNADSIRLMDEVGYK